ncbi:MAG: hypothetical protein RLZZ368_310 [Actinomycetota bacterium]|jgi:hypothetical protein
MERKKSEITSDQHLDQNHGAAMSDTYTSTEPARAHVRIIFNGPVAPHWDVVGDFGDRTLIDEFRTRALARLVLLPYTDPQFKRNRERIMRDGERENITVEWDLGFDESLIENTGR